MKNTVLESSVQSVKSADLFYIKYITGNDTGSTGSNQAGIHISKVAWPILFDSPGEKGSIKDSFREILWNDEFKTASRFVYYGAKTRNEYRITRFQRSFPFLRDEFEGSLFILTKKDDEYKAFVLCSDDEIDSFFAATSLSPLDVNHLFNLHQPSVDLVSDCIEAFLAPIKSFPSSAEISAAIQNCHKAQISSNNNDKLLLEWLTLEYGTFRRIEEKVYADNIKTPFVNIDELVKFANSILNRRKSRAGKSLENHLSEIFRREDLKFESQVITEGRHKPDFLFPGLSEYKKISVDESLLTMLAAKTTCKDRWRQILVEADRIKQKHLFTLQQGISANQLKEMYDKGVTLVVPSQNIETFPKAFRHKIVSLSLFIDKVKDLQKSLYG